MSSVHTTIKYQVAEHPTFYGYNTIDKLCWSGVPVAPFKVV